MKRNLKQLAKELAADLLAGDKSGNTGTTILAYYEPNAGTPRRVVPVVEHAGDPYKATEQAAHQMPTDADAVILTCAGWAAPQDDDDPQPNTPPSLHPKRKRCALVVARTLTRTPPAIISALALTGDDDIKTNDGTGTGTAPLADAINQLADHLTNR